MHDNQPEARSTEFRPVEGGPEIQSGSVLLVEAYAAAWLIVFAFIWLTFAKQRRLEQRLRAVEHAIDKAQEEP